MNVGDIVEILGYSLYYRGPWFIFGVMAAIIIPAILHISPIYVDCGCGAEAAMARQCYESYLLNLTDHWQCGVFNP